MFEVEDDAVSAAEAYAEQSPFPCIQAVLFEGFMVAAVSKVFIIFRCCASIVACAALCIIHHTCANMAIVYGTKIVINHMVNTVSKAALDQSMALSNI